ncbi:MAG: fatty acyl-AMP ligase, partial [Aestuariivirgaceae bacterium]
AGLVPCPMPYSMHIGGREAYVERIAGMLESADASAAISSCNLHDSIKAAADQAKVKLVMTHQELRAMPSDGAELHPFGADEVAYIQYSSGSTSHPKGVLITQKAICANTAGILRDGLKIEANDRAFSWLPLYHDMGLVGFCLSAMMGQVTVDYLATTAFARRPVLWLKLMSDNQCTVCYAPSFGYDLVARRVNGGAADLDLTQLRIAGIGGDMVRPDVLDMFCNNLAPSGFKPAAFLPSYGMAEATLAVTFVDVDSKYRTDIIDRAQTKLSGRAVPANSNIAANPDKARSLVMCGRPLPDHVIKVCDPDGNELGKREIGHILVKGPSIMAGYYNNQHDTNAIMQPDGFMATGDLGYWLDGEIVVTGRAKDMILHNGRNVWPQDIEWAAEKVEPLRGGDVAAFAVENEASEETIVVLAQCRLAKGGDLENLRRELSAAVYRACGVECDVVLVPPRSLPFTSSGKLSRAGAKQLYISGKIAEIARPAAEGIEDAVAAVG